MGEPSPDLHGATNKAELAAALIALACAILAITGVFPCVFASLCSLAVGAALLARSSEMAGERVHGSTRSRPRIAS